MNIKSSLVRLKRRLSRCGSFLLLFQRTPAAQVILPEVNFLTSAGGMEAAKAVIATVVGLGAFDSVAGATSVTQVAPSAGSSTVPVTAGTNLSGVFQLVGGGGHTPASWSVASGTLPAGLTLNSVRGKTTTLTGTTTESGSRTVTIRAWENSNFSGRSAAGTFTIQVSAPPPAAIATQPSSTTINRDQTATLTVVATGSNPLTYQWYRGSSGDTSEPVGSNAASYTTQALSVTTDYWVKVTNSQNATGAHSNTATVTVRQPAEIAQGPAPVTISSGTTATLSVVATGDAPLTYQWYQEVPGSSAVPVGTNSSSFTTPTLLETTSYWVKVTNVANTDGAISNTAIVTVTASATPNIYTASTLPPAKTGAAYQVQIHAVGGLAPYAWSVSEGSLPVGLTLSPEGLLSGTPEVNGTSQFTIQVEDDDNQIDTRVFSLSASNLTIAVETLPVPVKGVQYSHALTGLGGTGDFTWSYVSGSLPVGISLGSDGILSGIPQAEGNASFRVRLTDGVDFSVEQDFALAVSATYLVPVVKPIIFVPATIGADFKAMVAAANYPTKFAIKNLPKGLKYNAVTGVITGRASIAGSFDVIVTASNKAGTSAPVHGSLEIQALDTHLVGTFAGVIERTDSVNSSLGGWISLTTTSTGGYTLKVTSALPGSGSKAAGATYAAKGFLAEEAPQVEATLAGLPLQIIMDPETGDFSGSLGAAPIHGWHSTWTKSTPATAYEGYYSVALQEGVTVLAEAPPRPQGTGFATFTVSPLGVLKIAGKTADGETITAATFIDGEGDFGAYAPLYKKLGTLQGSMKLQTGVNSTEENRVTGDLTWLRPAITGRLYPLGFGPLNVVAEGGYLAPAKHKVILGLPAAGSVSVEFSGGGLDLSETDPNFSFDYSAAYKITPPLAVNNPGVAAISLAAATGKVAGKFTLTESTPLLKRPVAFQGQVVRLEDGSLKAVGYYLLPQIPEGSQKATATPILSGAVELIQPQP